MLKTLFTRRYFAPKRTSPSETDALSHPEIMRMTPRELADLPFNRR